MGNPRLVCARLLSGVQPVELAVDAWYNGAVAKRVQASVDDIVAAIETARDKVMSDEVKSLVKLGLPKSVALKMVADRYRQRGEDDGSETEQQTAWGDIS